MAAADPGLRFALLAGSARHLETAAHLPADRFRRLTLLPLVPEELGADFDFERLLRHGTRPRAGSATCRASSASCRSPADSTAGP